MTIKQLSTTLALVIITTLHSYAQDWQRLLLTDDNFYSIQKKAGKLFESEQRDTRSAAKTDSITDGEWMQYKRWEWFWQSRVDAKGRFPNVALNLGYYNSTQPKRGSMPQWRNISQQNCSGGYNGMGRTTCVAFDPIDSSTFYVGAPNGGLWKTTDGGLTYTPLTDMMPYVSVGQCVVDPKNRNTLYITVGDAPGWWIHTMGVYKSTNGGTTWKPTGLNYTLANGPSFRRLLINPLNPKTLFAATYNGLYVTHDSGHVWATVMTGAFSDLQYKPGDTTTLYTATDDYWGYSNIYKSTDGGKTFKQSTHFLNHYAYISLAVSPASKHMVAAMCSYDTSKSLYISHNTADTFMYTSQVPENSILYISPKDTHTIYTGYMKIWQSKNSGSTWKQLTMWYGGTGLPEVHADHHNVTFNPHNPDHLYFSCDGGLYRYSEKADAWTELSNGLVITQFYSIASAVTDTLVMIGGTQDNGGRKRDATGKWVGTNGGDAMVQAIDPTNDNIIYTTYVYGNLYRSNDQWVKNSSTISDSIPGGRPTGAWVTPYMLDPSDHNTIVAAYNDVYRSTNRGDHWTRLSHVITGDSTQVLTSLAVAPSDSNTIYTAYGSNLYVTTNLGGKWLTHPAPALQSISSITVNPHNPRHIWITCSGYNGGYKVFESYSSGATWRNISDSIPNISVNALIYLDDNKQTLFAGTDIGVFYRDTTMTYWQRYGEGLPNTIVTWFNIQATTNKLRIATYGRGIWEIALPQVVYNSGVKEIISSMAINVYPDPAQDVLNIEAKNIAHISSISILNVLGQQVMMKDIGLQGSTKWMMDVATLPKGVYLLRVSDDKQNVSVVKWIKE